ncbi:translation initiation factor IF-3 [Candidatus Peregrinibacteria bacterium]|nr:MAG: translation initiation factor IF-3 [Candidatus Peregrinibacteria bacterium]
MAKKLRINQAIRAHEVLVIDGEEKLGPMSVEEALALAEKRELDLVEVAPMEKPPVCKIMDYGTHLYKQKKKDKLNKKKVKKTETKTVRLSIRTDKHDLEVKAKQSRKFLEEKHLIKVVLIFKGREITHKDLGIEKMNYFYESLKDIAMMDQAPKPQGFQMIMILKPNK